MYILRKINMVETFNPKKDLVFIMQTPDSMGIFNTVEEVFTEAKAKKLPFFFIYDIIRKTGCGTRITSCFLNNSGEYYDCKKEIHQSKILLDHAY